jgi:membrane-associated phospholipid phosphatase
VALLSAGMLELFDTVVRPEQSDWGAFLDDLLVISEAVGVSLVATHTLRYATRRPRPIQYLPNASTGSAERHLSFPSGHTTASAAGVSAYAVTFWHRHPASPWRWVVAGGGALLTAFTAYTRVEAGMHFYTDVTAGILIGATAGIVVPLLHVYEAPVAVAVQPEPGGMQLGVSTTF